MAIRLILLTVSISLALVGCKHRSLGYPAKRVVKAHSGYVPVKTSHPTPLRAGYNANVRHAGVAGAPYTLDSGDRLRITVFGQNNLSRSYSVDAGGFISMPLIGAVSTRGISTFQLEARIASALKQKYVKDPKVTVEIETHRPFFILGEVRNGGQYPYVAGMTVQTAVAIAGGFTPRARKRSVKLTRRVNGATVTQTAPASWNVRPGDTITVQERFF